MPLLPRAGHTFLEHVSGFYSNRPARRAHLGHRIETGREYSRPAGIPDISFCAPNDRHRSARPPHLVNGYQGTLVAPDRFLCTARDVQGRAVRHRSGRLFFIGLAGSVTFHGVLRAGVLSVHADSTPTQVTAKLDPLETAPPQGRETGASISAPDSTSRPFQPSTYFRLFEAAPDGSDFLIFQPRIQTLSIYDHGKTDPAATAKLLQEAGGFLANGPDNDLSREPYPLGSPEWKGGDGSTENRYLEIVELVARQAMRHGEWLWPSLPAPSFRRLLPLSR